MIAARRNVVRRSKRVLAIALGALVALAVAWPATAEAQRKKRRARPAAKRPAAPPSKAAPPDQPPPARDEAKPSERDKGQDAPRRRRNKEQVFDFTGLELQGAMRTPQLLYFLERASQELDRASLERRSFVPEMVRSIEEERL